MVWHLFYIFSRLTLEFFEKPSTFTLNKSSSPSLPVSYHFWLFPFLHINKSQIPKPSPPVWESRSQTQVFSSIKWSLQSEIKLPSLPLNLQALWVKLNLERPLPSSLHEPWSLWQMCYLDAILDLRSGTMLHGSPLQKNGNKVKRFNFSSQFWKTEKKVHLHFKTKSLRSKWPQPASHKLSGSLYFIPGNQVSFLEWLSNRRKKVSWGGQ